MFSHTSPTNNGLIFLAYFFTFVNLQFTYKIPIDKKQTSEKKPTNLYLSNGLNVEDIKLYGTTICHFVQ